MIGLRIPINLKCLSTFKAEVIVFYCTDCIWFAYSTWVEFYTNIKSFTPNIEEK